jgi:hypothetical protein
MNKNCLPGIPLYEGLLEGNKILVRRCKRQAAVFHPAMFRIKGASKNSESAQMQDAEVGTQASCIAAARKKL